MANGRLTKSSQAAKNFRDCSTAWRATTKPVQPQSPVESAEERLKTLAKTTRFFDYVLKGNASDLDKHAGERVTVQGSVTGNTITAESINPATKMKKSKKS